MKKSEPGAPADPDEKLERLLQLAQEERFARNSPQWKIAMEEAIESHGECVEALFDELYRMLDERAAHNNPVKRWKSPPDPRKELQKRIVARLKDEIPAMVAAVIDEF